MSSLDEYVFVLKIDDFEVFLEDHFFVLVEVMTAQKEVVSGLVAGDPDSVSRSGHMAPVAYISQGNPF